MTVAYVILAVIVGDSIFKTIKAIRQKKYSDLLLLLLTIPFFVFFISACFLGGDALNDAAKNYPLYQQGHYYLVNHGRYTEVSQPVFIYMQIIEIIGLISFGIAFILSVISDRKSKSNDNLIQK